MHRAFRGGPGAIVCSLVLLAAATLSGSPSQAKEQPQLRELSAKLTCQGQPAGQSTPAGQPLFSWQHESELSAELSFTLEGYAGERRVELFAVLFEVPGPGRPARESKREVPLVKLRGEHQLAAGVQRVAFPELWNSAELAGLRHFRLELEVGLQGAKAQQRELLFAVSGPPLPELEIISLDIWSPAGGREQAFWEPGGQLALNMLFEIRGSKARRGPQLVIFAVMEEDRYLLRPEDGAYNYPGPHWDLRQLPSEDGVYQLVLNATMPVFFADAWSSNHAFTLHAALDAGLDRVVKAEAEGVVTDYYPGEERRSPELEQRLIRLDDAQRWDIRRRRAGVDSGRT